MIDYAHSGWPFRKLKIVLKKYIFMNIILDIS